MEKIFTRKFPPYIQAVSILIILLCPLLSLLLGKNYIFGGITAIGLTINLILIHSVKTRITPENKLTEGAFQTDIRNITRIELTKYAIRVFYISHYIHKEVKRVFYLKNRNDFAQSLKQINPDIQIKQKNEYEV